MATGALLDIVSHGTEQTRRLGYHLGTLAQPGDVVLLDGEFGTGKTTFTQGVARGLGLDPHYVNSPTFTLINEYRGGRHRLYHVDLYRLEGMEEVATLGLGDYFDGSGITVVEWPEHGEGFLPDDRLLIRFAFLSDTKRTLRFYARGDRYRQLVEAYKKDTYGP
ncbi:MAG: tRNA (adenosine(37)-N6)-threonylcarbamoyltransferase complex ATPase subunit type 1 TsaE [Chloroflexia bacterium]